MLQIYKLKFCKGDQIIQLVYSIVSHQEMTSSLHNLKKILNGPKIAPKTCQIRMQCSERHRMWTLKFFVKLCKMYYNMTNEILMHGTSSPFVDLSGTEFP